MPQNRWSANMRSARLLQERPKRMNSLGRISFLSRLRSWEICTHSFWPRYGVLRARVLKDLQNNNDNRLVTHLPHHLETFLPSQHKQILRHGPISAERHGKNPISWFKSTPLTRIDASSTFLSNVYSLQRVRNHFHLFQVASDRLDKVVEIIELANMYASCFRLVRICCLLHINLRNVLFCRVHLATD